MGNGVPETCRPVGRKKLVPARLSMSCMTAAASSGGKACKSRKAVTNSAQTKNGSRIQVMPGARNWMIVAMKLTAPSKEEVISRTMPMIQNVCPSQRWPRSATVAKGEYDVRSADLKRDHVIAKRRERHRHDG